MTNWTTHRMRWSCVSSLAGFVSAALLLADCSGVAGLAGGLPPPLIDPTARSDVSVGISRVIVELRLTPPFTPEGDLPNAAAVDAQRRTIGKVQSDLLGRLAG